VGHSTGGGEVARYIGQVRHKRVAKAVLIGAIPPLMLKDAEESGGLPIEVFDGIRAGVAADRSQFFKDLSLPFYGYNRAGAKVSEGVRNSFWLQGMMADSRRLTFASSVFGDRPHRRPQENPTSHAVFCMEMMIRSSNRGLGAARVKLVKGAKLIVYKGAPHGMCTRRKTASMRISWPSSNPKAVSRRKSRRTAYEIIENAIGRCTGRSPDESLPSASFLGDLRNSLLASTLGFRPGGSGGSGPVNGRRRDRLDGVVFHARSWVPAYGLC